MSSNKKLKPIIAKSYIKEKVFDNGGYVLNCSFDIEELKKLADQSGKVKMIISPLRNESPYGSTHKAVHDDWKPTAGYNKPQSQDEAPQELQDMANAMNNSNDDDLPF